MKRRVLTVVLALLLAVLGTAGVLAYVRQADARAVAGMRAVTALVAQQEIPAGTAASAALREGLLMRQVLPASSVPSDAVSSLTPDISSLVLSANLPPGQLLLRPMLVTTAQATAGGALAIPKGQVAVTIPLCLSAAVAGYVQPGSQVAVFDTYSRSTQGVSQNCSGSGASRPAGGVRTQIVLPRVQVLSVGAAPAGQAGGTNGALGTATASTSSAVNGPSGSVLVTMAVDQADAERLILLTETGVSYLALLTPSSQTAFDTVNLPLFQR